MNKPESSNEAISVTIAGSPNQSDHLPFDWEIYKDPSRPEFWDDGLDGSLPRPFLFLAGHPSKENAVKLKAWQRLQWETIEKIIKSLDGGEEELKLYSSFVGGPLMDHLKQKEFTEASFKSETIDNNTTINWGKVKLVYIYDSRCPACKKFNKVVDVLKSKKVQVYSLQADKEANNKRWKSKFPYTVTPTIYLKYKDHEPVKSEGYTSVNEIISYLNRKERI